MTGGHACGVLGQFRRVCRSPAGPLGGGGVVRCRAARIRYAVTVSAAASSAVAAAISVDKAQSLRVIRVPTIRL